MAMLVYRSGISWHFLWKNPWHTYTYLQKAWHHFDFQVRSRSTNKYTHVYIYIYLHKYEYLHTYIYIYEYIYTYIHIKPCEKKKVLLWPDSFPYFVSFLWLQTSSGTQNGSRLSSQWHRWQPPWGDSVLLGLGLQRVSSHMPLWGEFQYHTTVEETMKNPRFLINF